MRAICIQFQPRRAPDLDPAAVAGVLRTLGGEERLTSRMRVSEGVEDGPYVNVTYSTRDPVALWALVRVRVLDDAVLGPSLRRSVIVTCAGDSGWADYRLLHHFDACEPVEEMT